MKKWWLVPISAVGLALGWVIRDGESTPSTGASAHDHNLEPVPRRAKRPETSAHVAKWQSLGQQLPRYTYDERETLFKTLEPGEHMLALEALCAQNGAAHESEMGPWIKRILLSWAADDFDGVWNWRRSIGSDDLRRDVTRDLLEFLVEHDLERAIAIDQEQKAADPKYWSRVDTAALDKKTRESADGFLDLLSQFPFDSSSPSHGTSMVFAKDFNFQRAGDGVLEMTKAHGNQLPTVFPANFLAEWAGRDPDGAHAWWTEFPAIAFNSWLDLLEGIEEREGREFAAKWAAGKFAESGAPVRRMIHQLNLDPDAIELITEISTVMRDSPFRDGFLTDLFIETGNTRTIVFTISGMSSPEIRLRAFEKRKEARRHFNFEVFGESQFQEWGISLEQMDRIFSPSKQR